MSENVNSNRSSTPRPQIVIPSLATRQQIIDRYLNSINFIYDGIELIPAVLIFVTAYLSGVREEELKLQDNGLYMTYQILVSLIPAAQMLVIFLLIYRLVGFMITIKLFVL